jgi:rubrerythrin
MKYAADHALQVAAEMERLGQTFYESLSAGCGNAGIAALAARLAKDEKQHVAIFKRMRDALPPVHRGPTLTEEELFAAAGELRNTIMPGAQAVRKVVLAADLSKALDMAIKMEAGVVAYYSGLASGIAGLDAVALTKVTDEEKGHLSMLQKQRGRLFPSTPNART